MAEKRESRHGVSTRRVAGSVGRGMKFSMRHRFHLGYVTSHQRSTATLEASFPAVPPPLGPRICLACFGQANPVEETRLSVGGVISQFGPRSNSSICEIGIAVK